MSGAWPIQALRKNSPINPGIWAGIVYDNDNDAGTPRRNITITDAVLANIAAPPPPASARTGRRGLLQAPTLASPPASSNFSAADVSAEIDAGSLEGATAMRAALSQADLKVRKVQPWSEQTGYASVCTVCISLTVNGVLVWPCMGRSDMKI